jgi:hypothetical protein
MFDVVGTIDLLFRWHLLILFTRLLTITIIGLQHGMFHWNMQLKAILISPTVFGTGKLHWFSEREKKELVRRKLLTSIQTVHASKNILYKSLSGPGSPGTKRDNLVPFLIQLVQ